MKVQLNVSERLYALQILNAFKGDTQTLAAIVEDIRQFVISEEDWIAVGRTEEDGADGNKTWRWDDSKAEPKEIEVSKDTAKYIASVIDKKSTDGELTLQDKAVITLKSKLIA